MNFGHWKNFPFPTFLRLGLDNRLSRLDNHLSRLDKQLSSLDKRLSTLGLLVLLNVKPHKNHIFFLQTEHKFWNWPCHQLFLWCSEILQSESDNDDVDLFQNRPPRCDKPRVCNLWHKSGVRYMRTCQRCPDIYPWTGRTGVANSLVDRL